MSTSNSVVSTARLAATANGYRDATRSASISRDSSTAVGTEAGGDAAVLPDAELVGEHFVGSPGRERVAQDFDLLGGTSDIFGLLALGNSHSFSADGTVMEQTATAVFTLDITQLLDPQHLLIGLLGASTGQTAFDTMRFQVLIDDVTAISTRCS